MIRYEIAWSNICDIAVLKGISIADGRVLSEMNVDRPNEDILGRLFTAALDVALSSIFAVCAPRILSTLAAGSQNYDPEGRNNACLVRVRRQTRVVTSSGGSSPVPPPTHIRVHSGSLDQATMRNAGTFPQGHYFSLAGRNALYLNS